ncbi:sulfate permease [Seongchinamella sediminis]|uniref:Sulfate permease n=1 Tax=Seongchinamella sediminis TaxID=2283635 RepID=A0A3L7E1U7_9GAMM|nr:sulfate permease [Seongchinamella sediminis]RLQ22959.1 sulfate permease [Seongchinamella sediminis]
MPWQWLREYRRETFASDLLAGVIVTIMLIPQSLAYALLAGLPAEMGLYASILPLLAYALLGSSRTLSVGPVAVVSLMTAMAVGKIAETGSVEYASAAIALAALSGLMLLALGFLCFGFLANFLSHPVVSGFITASAIVIGLSQVRHLLGVEASGDNLPQLVLSLFRHIADTNPLTLLTGLLALVFLVWSRKSLQPLLLKLGLPTIAAGILSRAGPVLVMMATVVASYLLDFTQYDVALVGAIPSGLPSLSLPPLDTALWTQLAGSALLISIIGFVESVSVGKTLAAKRRQRINPNRELVALGGANMASAVSGGFPVTGGFSRSVVNFDAGAQTQAASILAAIGIALAALFLTPILRYLPNAALAATIIVAVSSLVDLELLRRAWRYSVSDFAAVITTIIATLLLGVELGVLAGIVVSILLHLYKTTRPHMAVVGAVAGTEHYRNVERHNVITHPNLVSLRIDESLYFANASYLEDYIYELVADNEKLEHVILQCTAVNEIDMSALEALEAIDHRLREQGITLNLSEVKGPVMDSLQSIDFLPHLSGRVFLSHHQAVKALKTDEIEPYII